MLTKAQIGNKSTWQNRNEPIGLPKQYLKGLMNRMVRTGSKLKEDAR